MLHKKDYNSFIKKLSECRWLSVVEWWFRGCLWIAFLLILVRVLTCGVRFRESGWFLLVIRSRWCGFLVLGLVGRWIFTFRIRFRWGFGFLLIFRSWLNVVGLPIPLVRPAASSIFGSALSPQSKALAR